MALHNIRIDHNGVTKVRRAVYPFAGRLHFTTIQKRLGKELTAEAVLPLDF